MDTKVFVAAFKSSTSLLVLISGIFAVFISLFAQPDDKYIVASFLFLFYGLANHYLVIFSTNETWRAYTRKGINFFVYLFISQWLFFGWVIVTLTLLLSPDVDSFRALWSVYYAFSSFLMSWASVFALAVAVWLLRMFEIKRKTELSTQDKLEISHN